MLPSGLRVRHLSPFLYSRSHVSSSVCCGLSFIGCPGREIMCVLVVRIAVFARASPWRSYMFFPEGGAR